MIQKLRIYAQKTESKQIVRVLFVTFFPKKNRKINFLVGGGDTFSAFNERLHAGYFCVVILASSYKLLKALIPLKYFEFD